MTDNERVSDRLQDLIEQVENMEYEKPKACDFWKAICCLPCVCCGLMCFWCYDREGAEELLGVMKEKKN